MFLFVNFLMLVNICFLVFMFVWFSILSIILFICLLLLWMDLMYCFSKDSWFLIFCCFFWLGDCFSLIWILLSNLIDFGEKLLMKFSGFFNLCVMFVVIWLSEVIFFWRINCFWVFSIFCVFLLMVCFNCWFFSFNCWVFYLL